MRKKVLAATLATIATTSLVTAPVAGAAETGEAGKCPAVHAVLVPGTSETTDWSDPNQDNHGYLSNMMTPVLSAVNKGFTGDKGAGFSDVLSDGKAATTNAGTETNGTDVPKLSRTYVPYHATAGGAWAGMGVTPGKPKNFGDTTSYEESVKGGVNEAEKVIEAVAEKCPGTKIDLIGYSQGAEVASAVSRRIGAGKTSIDPEKIAGVMLFSDPTRAGKTPAIASGADSMSSPAGTDGSAASQVLSNMSKISTPTAGGISTDKTNVDNFGDLEDRVVSWCLPGDYVCGLPADSELTRKLVGLVSKINLADPVEALQLLGESLNQATQTTNFNDVANLDYGQDGFSAAGLTDQANPETSVLAERARTTARDAFPEVSNPSATDTAATSTTESGTSATSTDTPDAQQTLTQESSTATATGTETGAADGEVMFPTTGDRDGVTTPSASGAELPSEINRTNGGVDAAADEPAAQPEAPVTPESAPPGQTGQPMSPDEFFNALVPLTARLGGMALGTGITWVRDSLTPENIGQIALAGVTGGPQAAATMASAKFSEAGMALLNPANIAGKSREALQAVKDSGFTVPETMELAVEMSSWLSTDEHVQYGKRPLMADGRTAEEATQQWLTATVSDASGADDVLDADLAPGAGQGMDTVKDLMDASGPVLEDTAFDVNKANDALDALTEGK
ncbi:cutinase family protein [Corynebacterium sp. 22_2729]